MSKSTWQEVAQEAQELRDASIARVKPAVPNVPDQLPLDVTGVSKDLLSAEEVALTQTAPDILASSLASGKHTCTAVITAFLRRAAIAQAATNCITELLPEKAYERAKFLDDYFHQHGKPIGPLHGLPISVKEHIGMRGLGLNAGFIGWWDRKGKDDALVLKILWKAGCIFYARTTQPQSLMHLETSSNLYGVTVNPFNRNLTCGGSSGGEGALLGMRGSCLGLGTDIGGSVRSPAANCGIYSLRPSSYRIPIEGWESTMLGEEQIIPILGPMSTSLEGLKLFMQTVIDAKPWLTDPSLVPIPWRYTKPSEKNMAEKKLKVGVIWHDGVVKPHPPITRALHEIVQKLRKVEGVSVVDWKPYNHDEAWKIVSTLYFPDGGAEEFAAIDGAKEPWRPLSNWILKENPNVKHLSVHEVWHWTRKREAYRSAYADLWNKTATGTNEKGEPDGMVDVLLCPVGPGVAPQLNTSKYWGYSAQWNLLDYPALVFPVSKVDLEKDAVGGQASEALSEKDAEIRTLYEGPEDFRGAPVSLQLVGRRYEDEKVVEAMEFIEEAVGLPFAEFV